MKKIFQDLINFLKNKAQNRKLVIIFFTILFVLIFILGLINTNCSGEDKIVIIEKGLGSDETAQVLKDNGIINNKWGFVFYLWIRGYVNHIQAGEYLLNSNMGMPEIARKIVNGEVNKNYVRITIPEGWDIKKIETRLKENRVINEDEKIPVENEGYLFPDTYYFNKNSGADVVVKKMRDNFLKKISSISKDLLIDSSNRLRDAVIMASIIEKEVKTNEDKVIVSGIFWKRIENNMPLQSCATIAYILGIDKAQYTREDTRVKSPYNTYLNLGLPFGAISNPGLSSIKAAFEPQKTDYWYFLNTSDGTIIYSRTAEEHAQNKTKYLE
ncbi:MAG TPA: endolytic transglycosylase MltG [Candidatus Portnoybacteria bacterium]|nr:endolytic transglycosylase MltG [Candidatus Portnoybacteria bacterium]HPH52316.1 endolytic transglycosylase MltG [Candidatus Portnoybacteria bacterium]HPM28309.1 endolytic transglycosylase MltG [Candidatus Portnoybacteria bacterium]